jgi:hypothetical protein
MRLAAIALVCVSCASAPPAPTLTTFAEASGYKRTGRYDEVLSLCRDFARAYTSVTCETIGETTQGRPLVALRVAKHANLPYIYVEGGIHAGEIEGKDAGFLFVRRLLAGEIARGALDHVSLIFVPVLNPDGHELFRPNHRPNQRGPEEMGFRTNGARLNLNRDWVKTDAPEIQAAVRVLTKYDPLVLVDLHTTDGAKFQHDISVLISPNSPRPDSLDEAAAALSKHMMARLAEMGHMPIDFYPSFVDDERPESGFAKGEAPPRFSQAYMAMRGRIGILVETHSWRTYDERAESTYHTLEALFEDAVRNADSWAKAAREADAADAKLAGTDVPMMWKTDGKSREIEFLGYQYERRISELTGGVWLVYDETAPQVWRVPLYDTIEPAVTITAPKQGYIVDGGFARAVAAILDRHGIDYLPAGKRDAANDAKTGPKIDSRIEKNIDVEIEAFRAESVSFAPPFEGRTRAMIAGEWARETRSLDAGAIFVPIAQARARLILHLFEPSLPDSLAQWGLFNAVFERKEYAEPYVLEQAVRDMFAASPALADEFSEFVNRTPSPSTDARLDWIHRHHPSWDERVNLLPVYRLP